MIKMIWGVNQSNGSHEYTYEELNTTKDEWDEMTDHQKREILEDALDALPDTCWPVVESFEET